MSVNTSQVVHIVAEIVVLLSMTVYFMHENKKLASRIDSLSKKVEEQEEKLEKHDGVILDILKHLESSNKPKIVVNPLPSLSSISYKPGPGLCYINSNGDEVCTVPPTRTDDGLEDIHEEEEEEEDDGGVDDDEEVVEVEKEVETKSSDDDVVTIPSITDNVVILMAPVMPSMEPVSTSTVEEVIEEDESVIPPSAPKKKRKRHKQRSKQPTVTDIDKELENELNELLSEELGKKN
jgi:hypothetical protein